MGTLIRRAFIAIPVTAGPWYAQLVEQFPKAVRAQHPADLHLTLAFLGDCELADALATWRLAARHAPAQQRLSLLSAALFGHGRALGFDLAHTAVLKSWIDRYRGLLIDTARGRPDPRPARPHLTVAWARRRRLSPVDHNEVLKVLALHQGQLLNVERIALWCRFDEAPVKGPRYRSLAQASLAPATQ